MEIEVTNRLSEILQERDISQLAFARECKLGEGHVSKICRNLMVPKLPTAFLICDQLGLKIEDVFSHSNGCSDA